MGYTYFSAKLGHDPILTGARDSCTERYVDGLRILPVDLLNTLRLTWNASNLKLSRQALFPLAVLGRRLKGYDIYHGHIYMCGFIASYHARMNHAVAVNTIHGSYYPIWNEIANPVTAGFYRSCERFLAPILAKHVHLQIHPAKYFAEQVLAWGAPADRLRVIHNGVNHPFSAGHRARKAGSFVTCFIYRKEAGKEEWA